MLYEAAQSMLYSKKWSWLKAWAMQITRRPWDEKGDRGAGASVGRDHAPHLGGRHRVPLDPGTNRGGNCRKLYRIKSNRRKLRLHRAVDDVPRGTTDEMSSHVRLDLQFRLTARPLQRLLHLILRSHNGRALAPIPKRSASLSDIDTAAADSPVLDPERPIREADINPVTLHS